MAITRRKALGALAGLTGVGVASVVGLGVYCARRPAVPASAADRLGLAFDDPADAIRVGQRYLAGHPEARDADRLVAAIEASLAVPDDFRCTATAGAALGAQNVADFRAGRVVWVDGWMMGRTETQVCALMALRGGRA